MNRNAAAWFPASEPAVRSWPIRYLAFKYAAAAIEPAAAAIGTGPPSAMILKESGSRQKTYVPSYRYQELILRRRTSKRQIDVVTVQQIPSAFCISEP